MSITKVLPLPANFPLILMAPTTDYSFTATFPLTLPDMEAHVRSALEKEHFGIITEIDIQATLKKKLNIAHPPHKILGACNPQIAYDALNENPDVALALPCNVVLYEKDKGITTVSAMLPSIALKPFKGLHVQESACKAEEALENVFDTICHLHPHHSHPHS